MTSKDEFPGNHISRDLGQLCMGGVHLSEIAAQHGTPLYIYDFNRIKTKANALAQAIKKVSKNSRCFYAVKALGNLSVIQAIHSQGLGMDVVSGGEIERALAAGVKASDIVFSGVAKTTSEIELGIREGIACFNIESPNELDELIRLTLGSSRRINVALRINPDVDGKTHAKINTGLAETKFGLSSNLAKSLAEKIIEIPTLSLSGVSCHIGSQILDLETIKSAALAMRSFAELLIKLGAPLRHVDMGGGLGVAYQPQDSLSVPSFQEWIEVARLAIPDKSVDLYLEPGRSIVADAGMLLSRVIDIKHGDKKKFAIIDAGMTELMRPALYDAYHHIAVVEDVPSTERSTYTVVGPVCETSCWINTNITLPQIRRGDLLAVMTTGAYGMSMASNYNTRPRPAEVAIENSKTRIIRKKETLSSLWESERFDQL
jgi:diaminopimelate decarboxylase